MAEEGKKFPNQLTEKAGLIFNPMLFRNDMKTFFENQDLEQPKYAGSHVAVAACMQELCRIIVQSAVKMTNKDKSGLRRLTRGLLRQTVFLHDGLNPYYLYHITTTFDKNQSYDKQLPFSWEKDVLKVVDKIDSDVHFHNKARNFLCFLLLKAYLDILDTSYRFISFTDRKTLCCKSVFYAVKDKFYGSVGQDVSHEVQRASEAVGKTIDKVDDNADVEDDEVEDEEVDEAEEPKAKKSAKKNTKKSKAVIDEESSDSEGLPSEDELSSDSESSIEVKPKKKASKKKSLKKSKR